MISHSLRTWLGWRKTRSDQKARAIAVSLDCMQFRSYDLACSQYPRRSWRSCHPSQAWSRMNGVMDIKRGRVGLKITTMPCSANDLRYDVFTNTASVTAMRSIWSIIGRATLRHETHFGILPLPWLDRLLLTVTHSVVGGVLQQSKSDKNRCTDD